MRLAIGLDMQRAVRHQRPICDCLRRVVVATRCREAAIRYRLQLAAGTGERRLAARSQFSPGTGSCRDICIMDMHVDVHIGIRTQHAARVVAFDQAQFG